MVECKLCRGESMTLHWFLELSIGLDWIGQALELS